ncbi:MAG: ribonuclease III domain-containing protein [Mastigocoleus sp. MO_167.B18]|nr:ribonuclease III domain-containing protein [Mastigocoleus sp. MO_167.B18]
MTLKGQEHLGKKDESPSKHSSTCETLANKLEQFSNMVDRSQLQQISPTALAYLGDAVYELYVRTFYLIPQKQAKTYHHLVVTQVRAETQAKLLRSLWEYLTTTELEIVRKGRNAATGRPKRLDPQTYQQATSLETLIGYLYLTDIQRLNELLNKLNLEN